MPFCASSIDGTRIAYEVRGAGQPGLVLVHGWSCSRRYWDAQLAALSHTARLVAIDLAGHGDSEALRKDWSMAAFGADVSSVVDVLGLHDVILVGHSMGADVALQAARNLAGRVRGIVWVDEYGQLDRFRDANQVQERVAPFRSDFAGAAAGFIRRMFPPCADASLAERVAVAISSAPQEVALPALEATWNHARMVPALLAELKLPVVAINSGAAHTDEASLRRHGVEAIIMPGVGHFPMLEQPQQFNACLADAVGRIKAR